MWNRMDKDEFVGLILIRYDEYLDIELLISKYCLLSG